MLDAIVIGAGHNGLVAASYLAKAKRKVLVLERRDVVGGILADDEVVPGARVPAVVHTVGRLLGSVIADLKPDVQLIRPEARMTALQQDGRALTFWSDVERTAAEIRSFSEADAAAYPAFDREVRAYASFLAHLNAQTPPDIEAPSLADAIRALKLGRAFRSLGTKAGRELTRVLPMAIADVAQEHFESDAVRGAIAARAVQFAKMGPWSAGTAMVYLNESAGNDGGAAGQTVYARGGPGALAGALADAAKRFGAEVRTGAEVVQVSTRDGRATGVVLASGEEIPARGVVSAADPKRTLTHWIDPVVIGPHLRWQAENIRQPGCTAKVNLVLSGLPTFAGVDDPARLQGRLVIAPSIDYVERAFDASKYGRISEEPYLEATIPSIADPSLAPQGSHVMSVIAQWAPYHLRDANWDREREALGDLVVKTLEAYAPGFGELVTARRVLAPPDLERDFGLSGGHVLHAEPGLECFFAWRPLLGHARYRFGIEGLYLAGSGAHPGGGITGGPGANAAREILKDLRRS